MQGIFLIITILNEKKNQLSESDFKWPDQVVSLFVLA